MKVKYQKPETEIILMETEESVMKMSINPDTNPTLPGLDQTKSSFFKDSEGILGGNE